MEKKISYASEYIRVLNYAGVLYLDRITSVFEVIINRPKITFGLNSPRCRNVYFLNFIIFLFLSILKGKLLFVLSGNQDLPNTLLPRGAVQFSEGYNENLLTQNLWIYFSLRKTRMQRIFRILKGLSNIVFKSVVL